MRAAIIDPATPDRVALYHIMIWEQPGGLNIAIIGHKVADMATQPPSRPGAAILAALSQLAAPGKLWTDPPMPIDITMMVPTVRSVVCGAEIPEEYHRLVANYLGANP